MVDALSQNKTKDIAKNIHDKIQELPDATTVTIYADGSGIDKKIDAAAFNSTTGEVSHQHLGGETQFNVYTAEITALQLAIEIPQAISRCHIYTDSQTTIKAIERPQRQSGQSIIKDLLDCVDGVMDKHTYLQIDISNMDTRTLGNTRKRASGRGGVEDSSGFDVNSTAQAQAIKICQDKTHKNGSKGTVAKNLDGGTKNAKTLRRITKIKRKGNKMGSKLYNDIVNRDTAAMIVQLLPGKAVVCIYMVLPNFFSQC
jgi:ribonuclease HI